MITKNKFGIKGIVLISLVFFISIIANASAKLAFDNDCPVSSASNVNFSNGTAIFLPFTYNETNTTNSNLTIFLGTSAGYFCSAINGSLSTFAANRTVIFTPEFLNALKTSTCSATFESYMENYRKSGNILSSTGTVFCGIRNITFDSTTSPSGITFNYPFIGYGNLTIGSYVYNGTQVKKYMIAYLMNNPDVELSGIVSTFANAVGINWSQGCNGITSSTAFFNAGKGNYTANFKSNILGTNLTAGESLTPSGGAGGIFGWLLDYALGNQTLPIITAANLSTNKIYVCGTVALENDYSNSTVTTANNATTVTSTDINATLEIKTNASVTNATVEIAEYPENPQTAGAVGFTALNKYVGIRISSSLENALSSVIIKIYYTDAEVSAAGLQEDTLRLYYYNKTSSSWQAYDSPNGGVDTTNNYVWANTTHFSDWGIFGTAPASSHHGNYVIPAANATATGCTTQWSCIEWSQCINGIQTRFCNNAGTCNLNPAKETRTCIVTPIIPVTIPTSPAKTAPSAPVTGAAIAPPTKPIVPLQTLWFSLIAALLIIGMISWVVLKKRNSNREGLGEKIKETRKIIRGAKREIKRVRKQEKKAEKRKRRR